MEFKRINEFDTEELLEELLDRFDSACFAGLRIDSKLENDYLMNWHGEENLIIQLCADVIADVRMPEEEEQDAED